MTPREYGAQAQGNGIPCVPFLDIDFMETVPDDGNHGATLTAYREWNRGWTEANLKGKERVQ